MFQKMVKERDGKYTVILPKHSTCFGVKYLTGKPGYDYQSGEIIEYSFKKDRFNGKVNLSTDEIYDRYMKKFWSRPFKLNYDYKRNAYTSWDYV